MSLRYTTENAGQVTQPGLITSIQKSQKFLRCCIAQVWMKSSNKQSLGIHSTTISGIQMMLESGSIWMSQHVSSLLTRLCRSQIFTSLMSSTIWTRPATMRSHAPIAQSRSSIGIYTVSMVTWARLLRSKPWRREKVVRDRLFFQDLSILDHRGTVLSGQEIAAQTGITFIDVLQFYFKRVSVASASSEAMCPASTGTHLSRIQKSLTQSYTSTFTALVFSCPFSGLTLISSQSDGSHTCSIKTPSQHAKTWSNSDIDYYATCTPSFTRITQKVSLW